MLRLPIVGFVVLCVALLLPSTAHASAASFARADFDSTAIGSIQPDVLDMALGIAAIVTPAGWANVWLAIGFGGLHVAFGLYIASNHGG